MIDKLKKKVEAIATLVEIHEGRHAVDPAVLTTPESSRLKDKELAASVGAAQHVIRELRELMTVADNWVETLQEQIAMFADDMELPTVEEQRQVVKQKARTKTISL